MRWKSKWDLFVVSFSLSSLRDLCPSSLRFFFFFCIWNHLLPLFHFRWLLHFIFWEAVNSVISYEPYFTIYTVEELSFRWVQAIWGPRKCFLPSYGFHFILRIYYCPVNLSPSTNYCIWKQVRYLFYYCI